MTRDAFYMAKHALYIVKDTFYIVRDVLYMAKYAPRVDRCSLHGQMLLMWTEMLFTWCAGCLCADLRSIRVFRRAEDQVHAGDHNARQVDW